MTARLRQWFAQRRSRTTDLARRAVPLALSINGVVLISAGIGQIYGPAGWIAAGLGSFALEWRIDGE
jgi:precorrin-3B methylase